MANDTLTYTVEDYRYYQEHGKFPPPKKVTAKKALKAIEADDIYWELLQEVKNGKAIFIPGNVPSSKNSKEIMQMPTGKSACCNAPYLKIGNKTYLCTKCDCTTYLGKRPVLVNSKTVKKYLIDHEQDYIKAKPIFDSWDLPEPSWLGFYYIRDSLRRFDGINAGQIAFDTFVETKCLRDDNMDVVRYVDLGYHKDNKRPGLIIIPLLKFKEMRNKLW